jgi:DNA/RNA-binding domain of Phe-tRNA-synthetase-like protein
MEGVAEAGSSNNRQVKELQVDVAPGWVRAFPGAQVGMLALEGVANPPTHAGLEPRVRAIEARLRQQYAHLQRSDLAALPIVQAYQRHYRAFGQTYHVVRQLESVVLKGKPLASHSALVLAMFAAELDSLLLTAAHDLDAVEPPIVLDASHEGERFVGIGGQEHVLRSGDMLMRDGSGILSAVVYGPDRRTRVGEKTRHVLFTTYAPTGIDPYLVMRHLDQLAELVRTMSPQAKPILQMIYP